jgi:hypothetical protein
MKTLIWIIILVLVIWGIVAVSSDGDSGEDATPTPETVTVQYSVTVKNVSEDQPLSPGVFVTHTSDATLDFQGTQSPVALEPLAEYGANDDFIAFLGDVPGVLSIYAVNEPIAPGEEITFNVEADNSGNVYISGIQMVVGSNDGYALMNAVRLDGEAVTVEALNYDNGTEENENLLGGFDAGQPDPQRGDDNIDNGTATDPQEDVAVHEQLTQTIMEVTITPVIEDGEVEGSTAEEGDVTEEDVEDEVETE